MLWVLTYSWQKLFFGEMTRVGSIIKNVIFLVEFTVVIIHNVYEIEVVSCIIKVKMFIFQ